MSGDVQPRKRKEKRRKRADHEYHIQRIQCLEDDDGGTPPPTLVGPPDHGDNITLHVHKEGGTGGHWCARIIFFILLSILVGLVGVIIFEARGSTDVDTPVASSRWAMIFEGWVDDSVSLHEEESNDNKSSHDVVSHEEDDEHEEEHDENEEESDQAGSEEGAAASEEHEDEEDTEEDEQEEEEDEPNVDGGTNEQADDTEYEEANHGEPQGVSEENDDDDDDERDDANDSGTLEEVDEEETDSKNVEDNGNEDDDVQDSREDTEELLNVSIEGVSPSSILNEDDEEDLSYEFMGIPGVNDIDDHSDEPLEEIEDDLEIEEITNNDPVDLEAEKEEEIEEESSVAVKFGVGVALVVAAHFVLVRRWSNVDVELAAYNKEGPPDLSRRDTLISPTPLISKVHVKESMQQGSKVDNSNLLNRPSKDPDEPQISSISKRAELEIDTSESELHSGTEDDVNYDEDSEDEGEEEDEEEGEIVEIDDIELVAKLEAKYGKIPTPSPSEYEDDEELDDEDEDEDEEEEEEEEDESEEEDEEEGETEKHYDWKHVKAPKAHSGSNPTEHESKSTGPKGDQGRSATGGPQDIITSTNASDFDELLIQEELENWLLRDFDN